MPGIGAIVLAAGSSSRMGTPKQLLPWKKSTLLEHAIEQLRGASVDSLVVVLGAHEVEIRKDIDLRDLDVVVNSNWKSGMASSIVTGVRFLLEKHPEIDAVLIALSDQPLLDSNYYKMLISKRVGLNKKIVASSYAGKMGVPAIFDKCYFDRLLDLSGSSGARSLLRKGSVPLASVELNDLAVDLDTREEYEHIFELHGRI